MFRRTWARLIPLAEAQKLVADATAPSTAALPTILNALTEHYRQGGEDFTRAALQRVVQLDQSNEDTQHVASTRVVEAGSAAAAAGSQPATRSLVTELLRSYPHSPEIRERCCRCIANVCQLSADTEGRSVAAVASGDNTAAAPSLADALVEEGAVELVLGTLAMANRLSPRGRCWAAMAMLNITCMSHSGAQRATKAGAVDKVAEFVLFLLDDASSPTSASTMEGPLRGVSEEAMIALDAALGALAAVLAAEAAENSKGISFNYEAVSYVAVDAVVRALLFVSALLVRDGRNDGAYGASLPSRRYGTVSFPNASPTQQTAVVVLLPLLHKAWMALQAVSSCSTNLPMVFDVVYEAANVNQESMMVANDLVAGGSEEVLEVTAQTERQYVAALSSLVDGALFLTTELEGLEAVGADELARLQRDVRLNVMDAMQSMTASRKDMARRGASADAKSDGAATHTEQSAEAEEGDEVGVYPTAAAMGVTDVLASGTVGSMALACAVRLHTEHQELNQRAGKAGGAATAAPYSTQDFTLLSKSLLVLANVAEAGDEVATSANSVAALQAVLVDAVEEVVALPRAYRSALAELFKPTEEAAAREAASAIHEDDRLAFLQQAALVGQVYSVLWSTLRTAQGVTTVSQLRVLETATAVQTSLRVSYLPAVEAAREKYGGACASPSVSAQEAEKLSAPSSSPSSSDTATKKQWVPNTAEETVVRLLKLSDELIDNLSKLTDAARSPAAAPNP